MTHSIILSKMATTQLLRLNRNLRAFEADKIRRRSVSLQNREGLKRGRPSTALAHTSYLKWGTHAGPALKK